MLHFSNSKLKTVDFHSGQTNTYIRQKIKLELKSDLLSSKYYTIKSKETCTYELI